MCINPHTSADPVKYAKFLNGRRKKPNIHGVENISKISNMLAITKIKVLPI